MKRISRSITLRLSAAFGLIALVVFSAAGVLLYHSLVRELEHTDHEALQGKVEVVRHLVNEAKLSGSNLGTLSRHLDDVVMGQAGLCVWLLSEQGEPVYGAQALPVVKSAGAGGILQLLQDDGVRMEGLKMSLPSAAPLPFSQALVAVNLQPRQRMLASYRNGLVVVCTLGVLLALGCGAAATWHSLRPVKRLSQAADQIAPTSLATRLPLAQVDVELIDLARAFNSALDRVERAYRQMEAFNANVAHELRTPLNTLINGAQVTLSGNRSNTELRETLVSSLEDVERLKAMVNDMLFLARADQGDKALSLEQVELADEVAKAIDYFEPLLHEAGLSAVCEGHASVRCNPSLVRRALVNLLSNAAKHTAPGEALVVRIAPSRGSVGVSVYNPGAPPAPQVIEHMFDRFFRADESRAQPGESNGLGLAIVRAVAQMHGGNVFAHAHPAGLTVGFTIAV